MASERTTWSFKANSEQDAALRSYWEAEDGRTKSEALAHYVNEGIRHEQETGGGPSSLPTILLNGVVQMAVLAIVMLMLGPGLNIIRARTAALVGVGLLALAFWILISIHMGWVGRLTSGIRSHLAWARERHEADLEHDREPEAEVDA